MQIQELHNVFLKHPLIITDSRNTVPGSIFFALKGATFNGNDFAHQCVENGCAYAVVDDPNVKGDRMIHVDDVLATLQKLATFHRHHCRAKVFAITGTNGKTTTKELTAAVLSSSFRIVFTQGNLNNHIGVPLTLLSIKEDTEIAIVEMGANHPGEIDQLCHIADPDAGLVTNVGIAHIEGFGSFEGIVKTKTELYRYLQERKRPVLVNGLNQRLVAHAKKDNDLFYGSGPDALVTAAAEMGNVLLSVRWKNKEGKEYRVNTNLSGDYNLENVMAALAGGTYFGISSEKMNNAISGYVPSNKRSQLVQTERNEILVDAYNANPTSMKAAITNLSGIEKKNKVLILGDMFELGETSETEHRKIMQLIQDAGFTEVFLAGSYFCKGRGQFPFHFFDSTSDLAAHLQSKPLSGNFILLKGSRGMKMETVLQFL